MVEQRDRSVRDAPGPFGVTCHQVNQCISVLPRFDQTGQSQSSQFLNLAALKALPNPAVELLASAGERILRRPQNHAHHGTRDVPEAACTK